MFRTASVGQPANMQEAQVGTVVRFTVVAAVAAVGFLVVGALWRGHGFSQRYGLARRRDGPADPHRGHADPGATIKAQPIGWAFIVGRETSRPSITSDQCDQIFLAQPGIPRNSKLLSPFLELSDGPAFVGAGPTGSKEPNVVDIGSRHSGTRHLLPPLLRFRFLGGTCTQGAHRVKHWLTIGIHPDRDPR